MAGWDFGSMAKGFGDWVGEQGSRVAFQGKRAWNALGEQGFSSPRFNHQPGPKGYDPNDYDFWGVAKEKPQAAVPVTPAATSAAAAPATVYANPDARKKQQEAWDAAGFVPEVYRSAAAPTTPPAAPPAATLQAPGFAPNPYLDKLLDQLKAFETRSGQIYGDINALQNPFDTSGEMFKKALAGNLNQVTMDNAGSNQRLLNRLGQEGRLGSAGADAALASMYRSSQQALSDVEMGMNRDALRAGADFDLRKQQALASVAQGDLAGAGGMYGNLFQTALGQGNWDKSFAAGREDAAAGRKQQADQFAVSAGLQARGLDNQGRGLDLQQKALDLGQVNRLDEREQAFWNNLIQGGALAAKYGDKLGGLLDLIGKGFVNVRDVMADFQGGNGTQVPYAPGYTPGPSMGFGPYAGPSPNFPGASGVSVPLGGSTLRF